MIKLLHVFRTIFVVTLTINAKYSLLSPWHLKCLSFSQLTKLPRDLLAANYVDIDSITPLFLIKAGSPPSGFLTEKSQTWIWQAKPMMLYMTSEDLQPLPSQRLWRPLDPKATCLGNGVFHFN